MLSVVATVALLAVSVVDGPWVDPQLEPAWQLVLETVDREGRPVGALYALLAAQSVAWVGVGETGHALAGLERAERRIVVSERVVAEEDVRFVAALLVHEVAHAWQEKLRGDGLTGRNLDCIGGEIEAYERQVQFWVLLWPDGELPRRTTAERALTDLTALYELEGREGLRRLVEANAAYREACGLDAA